MIYSILKIHFFVVIWITLPWALLCRQECISGDDCVFAQKCREGQCVFRDVDVCHSEKDCPLADQACLENMCIIVKTPAKQGEKCSSRVPCDRGLTCKRHKCLLSSSRRKPRSVPLKKDCKKDCEDICESHNCYNKTHCQHNEDCKKTQECLGGTCEHRRKRHRKGKRLLRKRFTLKTLKRLKKFPFVKQIEKEIRKDVFPKLMSAFRTIIETINLEKIIKTKDLVQSLRKYVARDGGHHRRHSKKSSYFTVATITK